MVIISKPVRKFVNLIRFLLTMSVDLRYYTEFFTHCNFKTTTASEEKVQFHWRLEVIVRSFGRNSSPVQVRQEFLKSYQI